MLATDSIFPHAFPACDGLVPAQIGSIFASCLLFNSCSTGNPLMKFLTDASVSLDIRHPLGSKCQWKNALQTDFVQM
jgi:hypothetical protein